MSSPNEREDNASEPLSTDGLPQGGTLDELTERLRDAGGVDSDWANAIAENWKRVLGAGIIIMLAVWFINDFRRAGEQKKGDASDKFANLEEVYRSAIAPLPGDTAEDKAQQERMLQALSSNVELMDKGYSDTVYAQFAYLYSASAYLRQGELQKAREVLARFDLKRFQNVTAIVPAQKMTGEDVVQELAALIDLRTYISDPSANSADVRARAKSLVYSARWVSVDALLILARLSTTQAEKTEVTELAGSIAKARPELRESITRGLSELGYDVTPVI